MMLHFVRGLFLVMGVIAMQRAVIVLQSFGERPAEHRTLQENLWFLGELYGGIAMLFVSQLIP
jgi:hypothetical protein